MADPDVADVVELELRRGRQHHVGHGRRGRHEDLGDGEEVELHEGLVGQPAVGIREHGVAAHHVGAADGVRDVLQDRLAEKGRSVRHETRDDAVEVSDHLLALVGDEVGPDHGRQALHLGVPGVDVSAGDIEISVIAMRQIRARVVSKVCVLCSMGFPTGWLRAWQPRRHGRPGGWYRPAPR